MAKSALGTWLGGFTLSDVLDKSLKSFKVEVASQSLRSVRGFGGFALNDFLDKSLKSIKVEVAWQSLRSVRGFGGFALNDFLNKTVKSFKVEVAWQSLRSVRGFGGLPCLILRSTVACWRSTDPSGSRTVITRELTHCR